MNNENVVTTSYPASIGRIVHFWSEAGDGPWAGIVVRVHPDAIGKVDLVTFGPHSVYHNNGIPHAEEPTPGCWNWPRIFPSRAESPR